MSAGVRAALLHATEILAQHTGDLPTGDINGRGLQERLADAYTAALEDLDLTGLPAAATAQFQTLHGRLTYAGPPAISAKLLGDDESIRLIQSIVDLCMETAEVSIADPGTYVLGKFLEAVHILAESRYYLGDRLATAVSHTFLAVAHANIPEEVMTAYEALRARLTYKAAVGDEGTIVATCADMSDDEAKEAISEIVRLYGVLIDIGARR